MNYDLCDLLNQKMENLFSYKLDENKNSMKNQLQFEKLFESTWEDEFISMFIDEPSEKKYFSNWIYRNGKISDNILDFDQSARKILREISNMTISNYPSIDIMYFSGVMKMIYCNDKFIYLETASKPSLDQLMSIKDFQKKINVNDESIFWRVCLKRSRNYFESGKNLNSLFKYNFMRIK